MDSPPTRRFLGWPARGWLLFGSYAGLVLSLIGFVLATEGTDDEALGMVSRTAVRAAFVAFAAAFGGWLIAHRPYLGVSFAFCHLLFLASNVTRSLVHYEHFFDLRPPVEWAAGGEAYLVIVAMAVTSFPTPARRIGPRAWRVLHTTGSYAVLLTFLDSFVFRALTKPAYVPWETAALILLGLRAAAFSKRHPHPCRALLAACRPGARA